MTSANAYEGRWMLCADDVEALDELRDELWEWRSFCEEPKDLLALGAAIHSIDSILDGELPTAAVTLTLSRSTIAYLDLDDIEGQDFYIEINHTGIALGQMTYVATGQGQSRDHHCETLTNLTERGAFNKYQIDNWLEKCCAMRSQSPALRCEIIELPSF